MPRRSKTICNHRACSKLVDRPGLCEKHKSQRQVWQRKQPTYYRLTGRKLIKARQELFKRQPLCQSCLGEGVRTPATIRDHVIPLAFGGKEHEDNVQALCEECHDKKTQSEMLEGKRRARMEREGATVKTFSAKGKEHRSEELREMKFVVG